MRRALFALLLASLLAGCTRGDPVEAIGGDVLPTPSTPSLAAFTLDGPTIRPPDGSDRPLYEDDERAIVRYSVGLPSDAPAAADAFVTFLLDGQIVDTERIRLAPGKSKAYERTLQDLEVGDRHGVEVRTGSATGTAEMTVLAWPRPGEPLELGPLTLRIDYGLQYPQDGRVVVNVTIARAAGSPDLSAFRVKLVCIAEGSLVLGESERAPLPEAGTSSGVDIGLSDCAEGQQRYGLEFKADDDAGTRMGRILFVPKSP